MHLYLLQTFISLCFWLLPFTATSQSLLVEPAVPDNPLVLSSRANVHRLDSLKRELVSQRYKTLPVYILTESFNNSLYLYNPDTKTGELDVLVYNEAGELLEQKKQGLYGKILQLDLHQLLRGNYYVQIVAADFVLTKKVKKRL